MPPSHLRLASGTLIDPELISSLMDAVPDSVMLVDEEHNIIALNQAVRSMMGVSARQAIGQRCYFAMHHQDEPISLCPLREAVSKGTAVEREFQAAESGRWLRCAVYLTDMLTESGKHVYLHAVRDITSWREGSLARERERQELSALMDMTGLVLGERSVREILHELLSRVLSLPWLQIERKGAILLGDASGEHLNMVASIGLSSEVQSACARVEKHYCLCGRAFAARSLIYAESLDARHDMSWNGMPDHGHYCLPINKGERCFGVMNCYLVPGHQRNEHEIGFLVTFTHLIAGFLERRENAEKTHEALVKLRISMEGTITALGRMLEVRDPYTAGHQGRVRDLALAIGREMGFDETRMEGLGIGAAVHDIGKVSVPAEILSKPGRISPAEMALIQTHTEAGHMILRGIDFPWPIADMVLQHHERWDGKGYPHGLSGQQIIPEALVIAVADVVEAIASHRPYRPSRGLKEALNVVESGRGQAFCPDVVDALFRVVAAGALPPWVAELANPDPV